MPKTIEEMTIAELRSAILMKQRLAKQAPKLRRNGTRSRSGCGRSMTCSPMLIPPVAAERRRRARWA